MRARSSSLEIGEPVTAQLNPHVANLNLPLDDETQSDRTSSIRAFFDYFDARIRNATGVEQRLAATHARALRKTACWVQL
jgi:hypothetical protein